MSPLRGFFVAAIVRWRRSLPPHGGSYIYGRGGNRHASLASLRL